MRDDIKTLKKQYDKTEDDLKALQSVGQIIGEVLKQLDEERCALSPRTRLTPAGTLSGGRPPQTRGNQRQLLVATPSCGHAARARALHAVREVARRANLPFARVRSHRQGVERASLRRWVQKQGVPHAQRRARTFDASVEHLPFSLSPSAIHPPARHSSHLRYPLTTMVSHTLLPTDPLSSARARRSTRRSSCRARAWRLT